MKNLKQSAAASFAANPTLEKLHVTTDGMCFADPHVAAQHGMKCGPEQDQRKVVVFSQEDVKGEIDDLQKLESAEGLFDPNALKKMKLDELRKVCTDSAIEFTEEDTKAILIEKINASIEKATDKKA